MSTATTTDFCDICGQPVSIRDGYGGWCSEYCASVPREERLLFKTAQPGDLVSYPCKECGAWIEDEYVPGGFCAEYSCQATRFKRDLTEAKAILFLCRQHVPSELRSLISDWMKGK